MMGPTEPLASGVIAYNDDSERGWNDPPTLSFNTVTGSKKGPKLDLRKRVSHQEALTGRRVISPLNQNPPSLYNQGTNLSNGLSNLTLGQQSPSQQVPPNVLQPSISPCHSRHSSGTYTPPLPPDAKNYGLVSPLMPVQPPCANVVQVPPTTNMVNPTTKVASPMIFSQVGATLQPNTGIIHPLAQRSTTNSLTQPATVAAEPPSNLGKPLFSFPSSFNVMPISSALDTSHVRANPVISPDTSPQTIDSVNTNVMAGFQNTNMATQAPLMFTPSPTSADGIPRLPTSTVAKRSPILNRAYQNGDGPKLYMPPPVNGSGRNSPLMAAALIAPALNRSPVSTPTGVHSASSTPRSTTPDDNGYHSERTSRHNSEDFDSEEGMGMTVEAIENTIIKCSDVLKAREVEDVRKKVEIMKQLWSDGKLCVPVQITMKLLTEVLSEGDTETAHKLHLKLMVDYVGEVKQWMVAIKRLILAMRNINTPVS